MTAASRRSCAVLFVLCLAASAAAASSRLDIVDRVPKFEKFYADAQGKDEAARWALWKKEYGIAAVPPTAEGDALARRQLDAAWPRYAALMPRLDTMEARAEKEARLLFEATNRLYATGGMPIHTKVVFFVGQFDGNEFTVPAMNGEPPTVVMPVENPRLRIELAHEMSHSVHFQLAGVKNSFGAPVGETIFLEGLAMHANKALVPGLPDAAYTELAGEPGWFARCTAGRAAIVKGIMPYLDKAGADVATRFTFGKGTTGMDRELYCAGWFAVGRLLASGKTFPRLARIPESEMIATVRAAMSE
ncbi:MAG: hypothetical protein KGJ78_12850 [Alphaproteobacteria bacterium]|nr:hypothetical protein [Alphaproteobacteria bacterium]